MKSNLKKLLDDRGISIRRFSEDTGLQFETLRRMYNDDTKQYNKLMIAKVCEELEVEISELLVLENTKAPPK
ncbi:helix-turn-helix transcriptional regulator [Fictibacillus norfolkensis]|uniref:helix-turn-helix domain-containing protein n=1 Tax=Fictibacillus norfolkensis TaxID=2762233 RepID=UPI00296AD2EC|nr:helix-turn-helix transcriptional regulator [Fictibacillus norfolkensis]